MAVDLSQYIKEGERFSILGYVPVERDDNTGLRPGEKLPDRVVYTTNDDTEAESLRRIGGFMAGEQWVVVTGYRDNTVQSGGTMKKQPLAGARKKPLPPQEF